MTTTPTDAIDTAILERGLKVAIELSTQAGAILRDSLDAERIVQLKGVVDLVTDVDRASEELISAGLREAFPDHRMTGEEGSVGADATMEEQPWGWTFDPLDGTTNYAHRYPHFAVSICLEHMGVPVAGAVYDPMRDELFAARLGGGATMNGRPITVSSTESLQHALLASGFSYAIHERGPQFRLWEYINNNARGVRRDGAAALDMCWVANGRLDGYWEQPVHSWDIGAGVIIVREAGGVVTALEHEGYDLYVPEAIAANPYIHPQLQGAIVSVLAGSAIDRA
jgi:myo-inositol-1(or 4)-monophosphatase